MYKTYLKLKSGKLKRTYFFTASQRRVNNKLTQ